MSAIDADKLFYEFQALTTEEKQHFWSSLNGEGRYLLAERILAATDANAETIAETERILKRPRKLSQILKRSLTRIHSAQEAKAKEEATNAAAWVSSRRGRRSGSGRQY